MLSIGTATGDCRDSVRKKKKEIFPATRQSLSSHSSRHVLSSSEVLPTLISPPSELSRLVLLQRIRTVKMSDESTNIPADPAERFAIGISFGNTSSSIARLSPVCVPRILIICMDFHLECILTRRGCRREKLRLSPTKREVSLQFLRSKFPCLERPRQAYVLSQIVKSHQFCPILRERNITVPRPSPSSSATPGTPLRISGIISARSNTLFLSLRMAAASNYLLTLFTVSSR